MSDALLPFSAVVGQEDAKLALLLAAIDRHIGGVLLRGDKGSAKSTLARGLAALLPGGAPFVELPIGATEDRVVGTLDLAAALTGGEKRFDPGLLAAADGGVLYVDEINLLPDHLVDVLLDVAASGTNRVEREGVSHTHPSRFLLIGSMNPEEGDLRPQLLDRFGLAVEVRTATDASARAEAVRRRFAFDDNPVGLLESFAGEEAAVAGRLAGVRPAVLPDDLIVAVSALCASVGAEGLRADLTICRAAAALAGWEGRASTDDADVRRVAGFALAHRARRDPLEPAGMDEQRLSDALDAHLGDRDGSDDTGDDVGDDGIADEAGDEQAPVAPGPNGVPFDAGPAAQRRPGAAAGRGAPSQAKRGRLIGDRQPGLLESGVAVAATVRAAANRIAADGGSGAGAPRVQRSDLREAVREQGSARLVVIAVDASGSMGAAERMAAAKGAVVGLLGDAYRRRDLVSLVAFRGDSADVLLRPTGSVEVARARLADLPTGGRTPLAAGISAALEVAMSPHRRATHEPLLVLITDGRATAAPAGVDPVEAASEAAGAVRRAGVEAVVLDVEGTAGGPSGIRLHLAQRLAVQMGARHLSLDELSPTAVQFALAGGTAAP